MKNIYDFWSRHGYFKEKCYNKSWIITISALIEWIERKTEREREREETERKTNKYLYVSYSI